MNPDDQERIEKNMRTIQLIYWTLFASIFVYGILGWFVTVTTGAIMKSPFLQNTMSLGLAGVSVLVLITMLVIRAYWLAPSALMDQSDELETALRNYQSVYIIQGSLLDSIAIYGLMVAMFTGNFYFYPGFAAVAIFFFLLLPPSRNDFETRLQKRGL